jgi:hypothetical protein
MRGGDTRAVKRHKYRQRSGLKNAVYSRLPSRIPARRSYALLPRRVTSMVAIGDEQLSMLPMSPDRLRPPT